MARTGRPRTFDRSEAVEQAMHLFWAHGYEATSLAMLKDAMGGISSPSFYAAFVAKETLFEEILERYVATYGAVSAVLQDPGVDPREAVETTLRGSARMQTDSTHPPGCLLVVSSTTTPEDASRIQAILSRDRTATKRGFAACVQRAVDSGQLSKKTDVPALALLYDTFMRGLTLQARDGVELARMEASISCLMQMWEGARKRAIPK